MGGVVAAGVALTGALDPSIAAANERAPPSAVRMQVLGSLHGMASFVTVYANGDYAIASPGKGGTVIRSDVEADVDGRVLKSSAYPQHTPAQAEFQDELGSGSLLTVTHTGLAGAPDLVCALRLYRDQAWGDIVVHVVNTTDRALSVSGDTDGACVGCSRHRFGRRGVRGPHSVRQLQRGSASARDP